MAKAKGNPGIQNRHIYTRASYLYQAAVYLANCAQRAEPGTNEETSLEKSQHDDDNASSRPERKATMNLSHQVVSDMRSVSLKAQIRQSPSIKQTICKYCDAVLIEGKTCHSSVENPSKGGRKPWADVLVIRCDTCSNVKRYPISAPRQKRKPLRTAGISETPKTERDGAPPVPAPAPALPTR
ncbi:Rpr2-domain-containing protein [Trichoderma citrinoviride]|uniref:Rpr2-domain-containing protein n=1 Tax=Trichoderma citrinoviride TaxID=58853 RepID=A0A2T4BMM0_9HYPO|nr:Rpr2-domain-containing protein [Trichoderma citrinoviride]PTB70553.1 Rpr2-domain-containing protein [Trichoderma citrinoviride]